jgi:tyrosyl-tRNA synthetase
MSGVVKSGKEARRLVSEKAVKLEGQSIQEITEKFEKRNFGSPQKLSIGKKKHFNIVII